MKLHTYGFANEHSNLIGYKTDQSCEGARDWAQEWLELHPDATCVEVWRDGRDEDGEPYPSFVVRREAATKEPVTSSGWYELTDGRVRRFSWLAGQLRAGDIVASWDDVPSDAKRLSDEGCYVTSEEPCCGEFGTGSEQHGDECERAEDSLARIAREDSEREDACTACQLLGCSRGSMCGLRQTNGDQQK